MTHTAARPDAGDTTAAAARYVAGCLIERLDNLRADLATFRDAAGSPEKMTEFAAELRREREEQYRGLDPCPADAGEREAGRRTGPGSGTSQRSPRPPRPRPSRRVTNAQTRR